MIYPEFSETSQIINFNKSFTSNVTNLWSKLPIFRDSMDKVPTVHLPMKKEIIRAELNNVGFMVQSNKKLPAGRYYHG